MAPMRNVLVSVESEIIGAMIDAGLASTRSDAIRMVAAHRGRPSGPLKEPALFRALQRAAASAPLSDDAIRDGIRRTKGARLP